MTATQADKAKIFRALHHRDTAFVIPNPWDIGTARILAAAGFEALATTSASPSPDQRIQANRSRSQYRGNARAFAPG